MASFHLESTDGRGILEPNPYIIKMAAIAVAGIDKYTDTETTDLGSHAKMIVLGKQALVIQDTGH